MNGKAEEHYSREEFERDRAGETGEQLAAERRAETDRQLAEAAYGKTSRLLDPQVAATIASVTPTWRPGQTNPSTRRLRRRDR
jgi:hypothetical protein